MKIRSYLKRLGFVLLIIPALFIAAPSVNSSEQPDPQTSQTYSQSPLLLLKVRQQIQATLEEVDKNLAAAAKELARTDLASPEAGSILARLCPNPAYPFLVDCCTIDPKGRILVVEPQAFKGSEGADISGQEQILRLHRTRQPVMSRTIAMVEGFEAVDLEQPVLSESGELLGSVSVLIKPDAFLASVIKPAIEGFPVDIWLMEKDGRILYDADAGALVQLHGMMS